MRRELASAWVLIALAGCDSAPAAPSTAAPPASSSAARRPAARPATSAAESRAAPPAKAPRPALAELELESSRYRARLAGRELRVVFATREKPLAAVGPAAHRAIAELVAPEVSAQTELVSLPLGEIARAARDPRAKKSLGELRVLGDGKVQSSLITLPAGELSRVDLADLSPGRPVLGWERTLGAKETPPAEQSALLAAYQKLLAVDYLADNRRRRHALLDADGGRLIAVDDNDAFSASWDERGVGDPYTRLAAHGVYSKSLLERLEKLDARALDAQLRRGPDRSLLIAPKQLEEVIERKRTLERLIAGRVRLRTRARALALP